MRSTKLLFLAYWLSLRVGDDCVWNDEAVDEKLFVLKHCEASEISLDFSKNFQYFSLCFGCCDSGVFRLSHIELGGVVPDEGGYFLRGVGG